MRGSYRFRPSGMPCWPHTPWMRARKSRHVLPWKRIATCRPPTFAMHMAANGKEQTRAQSVSCLGVQGRAPSMMTCAPNAPEILRRPRQHHVGTRSRRTGCRVFNWSCTIVTVRHRTERLRWPAYSAAFAKWLQVELKCRSSMQQAHNLDSSQFRECSELKERTNDSLCTVTHCWPSSGGTMLCLMHSYIGCYRSRGRSRVRQIKARGAPPQHNSWRKRGTGARTNEPPTRIRGRLAYGRHYSSSCSTEVIASISCDMVSRRPRNFRSGE